MKRHATRGWWRSAVVPVFVGTAIALTWACDTGSPISPSPGGAGSVGGASPSAPTPPQTRTSTLTSVLIQGQVVDADSNERIARARITTVQVASNGAYARPGVITTATADDLGRYTMEARLPEDWFDLMLEVTRDGYETARIYVNPRAGEETTLTAYRSLHVRAGESIEFNLNLGHYVCGYEGHRCRRVAVEAGPGGQVVVEVAPIDERDAAGVSVSSEPGFLPFPGYQRMVQTSGGYVYVFGGAFPPAPGRMRLTVR